MRARDAGFVTRLAPDALATHLEGDSKVSSRLWALLAGQKLGVTATARNWATVQKLLELADARAPS